MRARDLNWMQVEEYLSRDDRVVLPVGSTEQHGYLSLETDNILAERVSAEAAEPLGVLVLPVLPYGLTPSFAAYPGSPSLRLETFLAVLRDLLDSLHGQGFRRFLLVNGHGGNIAGRLARARVGGGAPGRAGDLPQLVVERARASRRAKRSTRSRATRTGSRTSPGRGWPASSCRRSASRRSTRPPTASPRPRSVRELLGDGVFARRLRAPGRAGRGRLARGRRGGSRAARERMAVDPLAVFHEWFEAAREAGVEAPEAMTLATADADGRPSARMLLLKSADERGFTFFTGYESRKGRELAENPRAALVFYWRPLGRQVRVEGTVRRLSAEESDAYWATPPAALAGRGRGLAAERADREPRGARGRVRARSSRRGEVPRPERWGGYVLEPEAIELWQHRDDRLHERIRFTRAREGWVGEQLAP